MKLTDVKMNLPMNNTIDERIDNYLLNIWNNKEFAIWLKTGKRYWIGPLLLPLNILERCCGPETDMEYVITKKSFDEAVDRIIKYIESWQYMEPMICQFTRNILSIRDWNHRYEAFERMWIHNYRVIIWTNSLEDYNACITYINTLFS